MIRTLSKFKNQAPPLMRFISSARAAYHPVKKVEFHGKNTLTVLGEPDSKDPNTPRTIPYEIKESTFKNAVGVTVGFALEFMIPYPLGPLVISGFCVNWIYQMTKMT